MLPHTFPFRLIDGSLNASRAVVEVSANASLTRGKRDLPISLAVEIVAQAAAYLLTADQRGRNPALVAVESAVLAGKVGVGARLTVFVAVERQYGRLTRIRGELEADGVRVGEVTMTLATQPVESRSE